MQLNRQQRRKLPTKPTAAEYRRQTILKLYNRINTYREVLQIIDNAKTIKQIKNAINVRIESTQNYINELNKEQNNHAN